MTALMHVPVSRPHMGDREIAYVTQALREHAISGLYGQFLDRFEKGFATFVGTKHAITCSSGTTALHLALVSYGIGPDDEVLASTLTNMATFFAIHYTGARAVPIDVCADTLTMDPAQLESRITARTRAILVVHLFGQVAEMDAIRNIAERHSLLLIEDCAEAHGATYRGRMAGALGDIGCFSFFANKILTTGEGGMLTTDDDAAADKARNLKALAFGTKDKFMHSDIGFNYRMTNVQAAIGCAQLEQLEHLIEKRRSISHFYSNRLAVFGDVLGLPIERSYAKNVYWMYHLALRGPLANGRFAITRELEARGIETRPGFVPFNLQRVFIERGLVRAADDCPQANALAFSTFYLPTAPDLTQAELDYVADNVVDVIKMHLR